jgi:hypothetical protein
MTTAPVGALSDCTGVSLPPFTAGALPIADIAETMARAESWANGEFTPGTLIVGITQAGAILGTETIPRALLIEARAHLA